MALDQSHEPANKEVKGERGAIGPTESPAEFQKWMLAGPEMARLVSEMGTSMENKKPSFTNIVLVFIEATFNRRNSRLRNLKSTPPFSTIMEQLRQNLLLRLDDNERDRKRRKTDDNTPN